MNALQTVYTGKGLKFSPSKPETEEGKPNGATDQKKHGENGNGANNLSSSDSSKNDTFAGLKKQVDKGKLTLN